MPASGLQGSRIARFLQPSVEMLLSSAGKNIALALRAPHIGTVQKDVMLAWDRTGLSIDDLLYAFDPGFALDRLHHLCCTTHG